MNELGSMETSLEGCAEAVTLFLTVFHLKQSGHLQLASCHHPVIITPWL